AKVSPDGIITTVPGGNGFRAVAADAAGNAYASSFLDDVHVGVFKTSPDGMATLVAGGGDTLGDGGPAIDAQIKNPWAFAVDSAGNLYIADLWDDRVRKVSSDGIITTV